MRHSTIFFVLIIFWEKSIAQQNLVPNPGFEVISDVSVCGTPCPTCGNYFIYNDQWDYWEKVNNWTIPDYKFCSGCLQLADLGCCVGSPDILCNDPSTAHTGSSCARVLIGDLPDYEYLTVQLLSPMKPYFNYHIEFFVFNLIADDPDNFGIHFSTEILKQCRAHKLDVEPQFIINSAPQGQWTFVSGTYTTVNADEWITIGNFGDNPISARIDDIAIWELGPGLGPCCPPFKLYEATDNLPSLTHVQSFIRAGYDAGVPNIAGNVTVKAGQNVTFKAGHHIELLPGFTTEPGAVFIAEPEECNYATKPNDIPIEIMSYPNVITPNSDGINDWLCVFVKGATNYTITVYDQWGQSDEFNGTGDIISDPVCLWDGSGSDCGETVYIYIEFTNCDHSASTAFYLEKLCSGKTNQTSLNNSDGSNSHDTIYLNEVIVNKDIKPVLQNNISSNVNSLSEIVITPNPTTGKFSLQLAVGNRQNSNARLEITDVLGKTLFVKDHVAPGVATPINLSHLQKDIYFLKISTEDEVRVEKVVIE